MEMYGRLRISVSCAPERVAAIVGDIILTDSGLSPLSEPSSAADGKNDAFKTILDVEAHLHTSTLGGTTNLHGPGSSLSWVFNGFIRFSSGTTVGGCVTVDTIADDQPPGRHVAPYSRSVSTCPQLLARIDPN